MLTTDNLTIDGTATFAQFVDYNDTRLYQFTSFDSEVFRCSSSGVIINKPLMTLGLFDTGNIGQIGSGTQYDLFRINAYMSAGTYDLKLCYYSGNDRGTAYIFIDGGTQIGTVNMYSAVATLTEATITNFAVAESKYHTIDLSMDSKDLSSAEYEGFWTYIRFYPHV